MINTILAVVLIAAVIGFAGLLFEWLSRRALNSDTPSDMSTGCHTRICRLCVMRDIGRAAELVALMTVAIAVTYFWVWSGGAR